MKKSLIPLLFISLTFPLFSHAEKKNKEVRPKEQDVSYFIYKNEINDIYQNCVYKFITTYDDDHEYTAYGTAFLEELTNILDHTDLLATHSKVMGRLEKLKSVCSAARVDLKSKHFPEEYVYLPVKYIKDGKQLSYDKSNFDPNKFKETYKKIINKIESNYDLKIESNKMYNFVAVNFKRPYKCSFFDRFSFSFSVILGGKGGIGKVKCVDYLGAEYKWGRAILDANMSGAVLSFSSGGENKFYMSKSSSEQHIIYSPEDTVTAGLISAEQQIGKDTETQFNPSIGVGIGTIHTISFSFTSKKEFKQINYEKILEPFLRELLLGETLWRRIKP